MAQRDTTTVMKSNHTHTHNTLIDRMALFGLYADVPLNVSRLSKTCEMCVCWIFGLSSHTDTGDYYVVVELRCQNGPASQRTFFFACWSLATFGVIPTNGTQSRSINFDGTYISDDVDFMLLLFYYYCHLSRSFISVFRLAPKRTVPCIDGAVFSRRVHAIMLPNVSHRYRQALH